MESKCWLMELSFTVSKRLKKNPSRSIPIPKIINKTILGCDLYFSNAFENSFGPKSLFRPCRYNEINSKKIANIIPISIRNILNSRDGSYEEKWYVLIPYVIPAKIGNKDLSEVKLKAMHFI